MMRILTIDGNVHYVNPAHVVEVRDDPNDGELFRTIIIIDNGKELHTKIPMENVISDLSGVAGTLRSAKRNVCDKLSKFFEQK